MRTTLAFAAAMMAATTIAHADVMTGKEIKSAVTGKRIYLATPLGGEFPLFYAPGGRVDGTGEALGIGKWVRPTDKGRWWVEGNALCQQWETWYDGKRTCFQLKRLAGDQLHWVRDDGYSGTARIGN
ncbi:MAG: hypothetical protein ACK50Q_00920 [Labrys sp. (in: a-proteobacteria)]|jgi:hypothetical protein